MSVSVGFMLLGDVSVFVVLCGCILLEIDLLIVLCDVLCLFYVLIMYGCFDDKLFVLWVDKVDVIFVVFGVVYDMWLYVVGYELIVEMVGDFG